MCVSVTGRTGGGRGRREGAVVALKLVGGERGVARSRADGRAVAVVFARRVSLLSRPVIFVNAAQRT